ncbi:39S ribosomal protein L34, mitochondrial [Lemmus lemmus]
MGLPDAWGLPFVQQQTRGARAGTSASPATSSTSTNTVGSAPVNTQTGVQVILRCRLKGHKSLSH